ncbi:MAG: LicD family protein [Clostridia bacterium]|nr:LicD family protein [Clostridia bacterium]
MNVPNEFYLEEERCGYTIPAAMKRVWAVELDLLEKLQEVCDRHGLRYYACGGTLLGAIRHKGFIPWDDDIDVVMLREDYEKLLAVAPQEFAEPYFFQTSFNDKNYSRGHAQLRNSNTTAILNSERGHFVFNQGIFIDIFPLDAVPDDPVQQQAHRRQVNVWNKLLAASVRYPGSVKKNKIKSLIHLFASVIPYRWLYRGLEKACRKYNGKDTQRVAMISFDTFSDRWVFPRRCFNEVQKAPFENTEIVIPAGYDEMLTIAYGDYMTMKKENSYHAGIFFDPDRSYMDYIK